MPTPRPRGPATPSTSDAFVDAGLRVFGRGGPEGFTVHAVIAESGKSLGSLYHHFGSFDGLAAAVYARCLGDLLDALVAVVVPKKDPRAGINALVRAYLAFTRERPAAALFIHAQSYASFLPKHAEVVHAAREPRLRVLLGWLEPHVKAGRIARVPAPLFEMLVVGPVAETARRWLAKDPAVDLDAAARVLPPRIWRSVAPVVVTR